MKNICFLLGNIQGNGGIARVVSIIANKLSENENFKVTIVSYCPAKEFAGYTYNQNIHMKQIYLEQVSMAKAILVKKAVRRLKEILHSEKIDILVACGELYFPMAILSTIGNKTKCYCWEHSDPAGTSDHKFQMLSRKFAIKKADEIVVLTKAAKEYYIKELGTKPDKITQIYNPVGSEVVQSSEYNRASKRILSVGRLSYQKNFQLLLDIAAQILPKYPEWSWDICGEGEDREELERIIKEKGLTNRVNLLGQVKNLYQEYQEYSFLVMTSRYEGFPMSLIEGAANRLPLVAFDVPTGPSEIICDGENGFLIRNNNKKDMEKKICCLIENNSIRGKMASCAFETSKRFELKRIIDMWEKLCLKN